MPQTCQHAPQIKHQERLDRPTHRRSGMLLVLLMQYVFLIASDACKLTILSGKKQLAGEWVARLCLLFSLESDSSLMTCVVVYMTHGTRAHL